MSPSIMDDWYNILNARSEPSTSALQELSDAGFLIVSGPVLPDQLPKFADAYDSALASANTGEISIGRSTTRVDDFVNRDPEFDQIYTFGPLLAACCHVIRQPFKLSTMHARDVHPHSKAQDLHVDFPRDETGWPMVGFIMMVDDFRTDNGATRFVPGSHIWSTTPNESTHVEDEVLARGPAGSMVIYNGSTWHGHAANRTEHPRRSVQGAYIRRDAEAAVKQSGRIRPETLSRIGSLEKYLLDL